MTESSRLQKSVGVHAYNRPIKVVYLVPAVEDTRSHWILDAIFYESYTRWGGANTLVIPTNPSQFDGEGYEQWLRSFDPDFVYSYVQLDQEFIKKINSICLPISLLCRPVRRVDSPETRWRDLSPDWGHYFKSVKSLSTILSPYANPLRFNRPPPTAVKTLLTQSIEPSEDRFLPDNFGVSHDMSMVTHAVSGLYETLCYIRPKEPGSRTVHGTREVSSIPEILGEIASGCVYTFATLARVHTDGLNRVEPHSWGRGFFLFIGETCKDRINFWNSRLLVPRWIDNHGSLLIKKAALDDDSFVAALGNYLNKFNFNRNGNSQPTVEIRSMSEGKDELSKIPAKFNHKTWSQFSVPNNFNAIVCPSEREIKDEGHFVRRNPTVFRLSENSNEIQAEPPVHFEYNAGAFSHLNTGDWSVDLDIERHNNLSKYSNVIDTWQLPRHLKVCKAFTDRLSKVSTGHLLTLIPTGQENFLSQHPVRRKTYELRLPSDIQFFRHLVVGVHPTDLNDARHGLENSRYVGLSHSDKGQNLRGVISMFDRFEDTYLSLTNKFWRDALRKFGRNDYDDEEDLTDPASEKRHIRYENQTVTEDKLFGQIPASHEFLDEYAKRIQIDRGIANKYLRAAVSDSLESLVERAVLYQIHVHRCEYCGHINETTIDDLKKENSCSICRTKYFAPINIPWKFKFNSFVTNSMVARNGLTVLWALGHLHRELFRGSFYYMPEANLFFEEGGIDKREEIDILSVGNGRFLVGEAKKTATSFLRKDGEMAKFITKVKALNPDVALLIFENFAEDANEVEKVKTDLNAARTTILKETGLSPGALSIVVASATRDFNEYGHDFGVIGSRLNAIIFPGEVSR